MNYLSKVTFIAAVACKSFPHKHRQRPSLHLFVCILHLIAINVYGHRNSFIHLNLKQYGKHIVSS